MPKKLSLPWPGSDWYEFVRYSVGTDQLFGELPHVMHVILDGENGLSNLFWSSLHLLKISIKFPELRTLEIHYVDCERDFEFPEKVDKIECITKLILREALCSSFQAMDLVQCFSKLEDVTTFDQCDRKDSNSDRVWLWDYHAIRKLLMCYLQCLKRLTIHSQNIDEYHSISLIEVSDFRALEYLSLSAQDLGTGSDYFPVATACDLMFKAKKLKTFVLYYGGLEDDEDDECKSKHKSKCTIHFLSTPGSFAEEKCKSMIL